MNKKEIQDIISKEPYFKQWQQDGLDCCIRRVRTHLCGYVGVKKDHPRWGLSSCHESICDIDVHGGITYSDYFYKSDGYSIGDGIWWLGFDCAHYDDISEVTFLIPDLLEGATYKDYNFVKKEVNNLLSQISKYNN